LSSSVPIHVFSPVCVLGLLDSENSVNLFWIEIYTTCLNV